MASLLADPPPNYNGEVVFSYGGGRQSVALVLLCVEGILPWPDHLIMADTGHENESTWNYHRAHIEPILTEHGKRLEIAGPEYATVGMHSRNGAVILPLYSTPRGKYSTWCSSEWKRRVRDRYMRAHRIRPRELWLGLGYEEQKRWSRTHRTHQGRTLVLAPLVDLQMTTQQGLELIQKHGLPLPTHSSCYFCPNKTNKEWLELKTTSRDQWDAALALDDELREESIEQGRGPVYLHYSRKPLAEAILTAADQTHDGRKCEAESCFT